MLRFPLCCRGRNVEKQYPAGELPWFESLTCIFRGYLNVETRVLQLAGAVRVTSLSLHLVGISAAAGTLLSSATSVQR